MNQCQVPTMLYHYTSLENLALILKNKTIRLNALEKMDDLQEQKTTDLGNWGKFHFISSWTEECREDIPMWKLYTPMISGVRIALPPMPFCWHSTSDENIMRAFAPVSATSKPLPEKGTFLDIKFLCQNGIYSVDAYYGDILHKVQYVTDRNLLEPCICEPKNRGFNIHMNKMGRYKNQYWSFQKEWRYLLCFFPIKYDMENLCFEHATEEDLDALYSASTGPGFSHFDLDIDPILFNTMEITPSPQMSPGNRILLETLIEKYNPNAKIIESELTHLL